LRGLHLPRAVATLAPPAELEAIAERIPLFEGRHAVDGRATAFVCQNMSCQLPVHTPEDLVRQLSEG
ncbi:MAG: hypothetical protein IIA41_12205, partial [SAR324 cluster bacterium]|nr:hypothetical protein [SAR324 cluster bacterium]